MSKARDQMICDSINNADHNLYSNPKPVELQTPSDSNLTKRVSHKSRGSQQGGTLKNSNENQSRVHPMHRNLFPPKPPQGSQTPKTKTQNPSCKRMYPPQKSPRGPPSHATPPKTPHRVPRLLPQGTLCTPTLLHPHKHPTPHSPTPHPLSKSKLPKAQLLGGRHPS